MSKHRHIVRTPTDGSRLNYIERNAISFELTAAFSNNKSSIKNIAGILALIYSIGKSYDEVLNLKINREINAKTGRVRIDLKLGKQQVKPKPEERNAFESCKESIKLNTHPLIHQWLLTLWQNNGAKTIKELIAKDPITQKQVSAFTKSIAQKYSKRINLRKIQCAFRFELSCLENNPTLSFLLNSKKENIQTPDTRYYLVYSLRRIERTWNAIQKSLWGIELKISQKENTWNGFLLKSQVLQDFTNRISTLPSKRDITKFHNQYTLFTIIMLTWNLGHRGVNDPFCNLDHWSDKDALMLINDKVTRGKHNFRILPITETLKTQLDNYRRHLRAICLKFKQLKLDELYRYVKSLFNVNRRNKYRYFFLINKNNHIEPIQPSKILEAFATHKLPVPDNFGRHDIASKLAEEFDFTHEEIQLYLGHEMGQKFKPSGELNLNNALIKINDSLESLLKRDGWQPLSGYPLPHDKEPLNVGSNHPSEFILPNQKIGHIRREEHRQKIKKKIINLSTEMINYYDDYCKGIHRDDSKEQEFLSKLKGLDFPQHEAWSELKKYINQNLEGVNPFNEVFKIFKSDPDNTFIHRRLVTNLEHAKSVQISWINWLNNTSKEGWQAWIENEKLHTKRQEKLISTLVINAALIGNIAKNNCLKCLINNNKFMNTASFTEGVMHVECYELIKSGAKNIDDQHNWVDRWIPDPFSACIYTQLDSKYSSTLTQINSSLSDIFNLAKLDIPSKNPFEQLTKIVRRLNKFYDDQYIASLKAGLVNRRPLRHITFVRLLTNKRADEFKLQTLEPQKKRLITIPKDEDLKEFYKKFYNLFDISKLHKNIPIQRNLELAEHIDELMKSNLHWLPDRVINFLEWTIFLCERGSRGYGNKKKAVLALSTLRKYTTMLARRILYDKTIDSFENLSSDEITKVFKKYVTEDKTENSNEFVQQLISFHTFSKEEGDIDDCDWSALDAVLTDYSPPQDGNIITPYEYQQFLAILASKANPRNYFETFQTLFVGIMMYRFGVRPLEACKILANDIITDDDGNIAYIIISKNSLADNKSKNAVRQIPSIYKLTIFETDIIKYFTNRADSYTKINKDFALIAKSINDNPTLYKNQLTSEVSHALKVVSGDKKVSAHTLRHSYATNAIANFHFEKYPNHPFKNQFESCDISEYNNHGTFDLMLLSLSKSIGHKYPATTLANYFHAHHIFLNPNHALINEINDDAFCFLLGITKKTYQAQKRRLNNSKENHKAAFSYIDNDSFSTYGTTQYRKKSPYPAPNFVNFDQKEKPLPYIFESLFTIKDNEEIQDKLISIYDENFLPDLQKEIKALQKTKKSHIFNWLEQNSESVTETLKKQKKRSTTSNQIKKWQEMLTVDKLHLIAIDETEVRSIQKLLKTIRIDTTIGRKTTRIETAKKSKLIKLDNHGKNSFHNNDRRKNGYQLTLLTNMLLKVTEVTIILIIIDLYIDSFYKRF